MGMDVHGVNPQQNKSIENYPLLKQMKELEKKEEWKKRRELLDNDEISNKYWKERDEFEGENKGIYFRNNCWWWRPLWDYCRIVAPDLIDDELYQSGHHNDGAGLDEAGAKELGQRLLKEIANGNTIKYQAEYQQRQEDATSVPPSKDNFLDGTDTYIEDEWVAQYPFDVDNVTEFANFCLECGGFEIC